MTARRLASNEEYRLVRREGSRYVDDLLVLYVRANGLQSTRVGISVARRVGGAVKRNRIRRRVQEAYRGLARALPPGVDIMVVPRAGAAEAPFRVLEASLRGLFAQAGSSPTPARDG